MCCHLLDLDLGLEIRVPFIKLQKSGQFSEKRRVNESLEDSRTDTHFQPHVWDNPGLRPPPHLLLFPRLPTPATLAYE